MKSQSQRWDEQPRQFSVLGALVALVVNIALLWAANAYEVWQPMTQGAVTKAWPEVLWAVNQGAAILSRMNRVPSATEKFESPRPVMGWESVYPIPRRQVAIRP